MTHTEACCCCGGHAFSTTLESCSDYLTGDSFIVESCNHCNLARTSPAPDSLESYYPSEYREYTRPVLLILKTLYRFRIIAWTRLFKKPGRVLEVGCGQGFMLSVLKDLGWDVYGIERNEQAARVAADITGTKIFVNGFSEVPETERYELIILFQVLEHMENPHALLLECEQHLAPDGRIIISVPNFGSWQAKIMGERWFHLDPPRHLFHFSPTTLKSLLQRSGLEIDSISFVSWEHDPYGWLQSLLNQTGFRYNRLTKLLMRVEAFERADIIFVPLVLLLGPISLLLAVASWIKSEGAIMTVIAKKQEDYVIRKT